MSCQTSQKVPILSISKIWVHVMTFCLNVLPEALPAGQELRSAIIKAGPPLEAILVIFGRRALIFFLFESSWKKMKNDATFVRMRSGDHLGDAKMSK